MAHLIFIIVSLALLVGFYFLVWYEKAHAVRALARERAHLDRQVERIAFIIAHVNLGAFLKEETGRIVARVGHDVAQFSLLVVRAVERLLTRLVRYLRIRRMNDDRAPRESAREFVRTLADFKGHLEATRPEMPPLQ